VVAATLVMLAFGAQGPMARGQNAPAQALGIVQVKPPQSVAVTPPRRARRVPVGQPRPEAVLKRLRFFRRPPGATTALFDRDRVEAGELLIVDPPVAVSSEILGLGFTVKEVLALGTLGHDVFLLGMPPGIGLAEALGFLRQSYPAMVSDANHLYELAAGPDLGMFAANMIGWGVADDGCGRDIRIGMIDTPVDARHAALDGQRLTTRSFISQGATPAHADHGTGVAAIMVGRSDSGPTAGLVPGARLFAANIFEARSGRAVGNSVGILKAIDWLARNEVSVINMSLSGRLDTVMRLAVRSAVAKGAVVVAAAGNHGPYARPAYPAAFEQVISVTAVDARRQLYFRANQGDYIDVAAPGVGIWTAVPGGGRMQTGTSFASPFVAAALALYIAHGAAGDPAALRARLERQAVDLGPPGKDPQFGWGLLQTGRLCGGGADASLAAPADRATNGTYITLKNANVRARPLLQATLVTTLRKGSRVDVVARAAGGQWLHVARDGRRLGYVYAPLMAPIGAALRP